MKILIVTAYYPPHHIGGYELGCRDVAQQLMQRGHEVSILTADFRHPNVPETAEPGIFRLLHRQSSPEGFNKRRECAVFLEKISTIQPDIIYFWSQSEICFWLAPLARRRGIPIAFYLSDTSFVAWRTRAWLARFAQRSRFVRQVFSGTFLVDGIPIVQNAACHFTSAFLREVAVKKAVRFDPDLSRVIHWGIDVALFRNDERRRWPLRKLLYVGQIIPEKGIHTALAALGALSREPGFGDLTFTVVGGVTRPQYDKELRELVDRLGIEELVHFAGRVERRELTRIYTEHDLLVFPSEWDEPFAITPLEAMASGLPVVATTTGGSAEIFRNRDTGITFEFGNAADCARAIRELCSDEQLARSVAQRGQHEVITRHTLSGMIDTIEESLEEILKHSRR